jgi:hypothetical protein
MKAFFIQPHIWFFQETKGDKHAKGLFAVLTGAGKIAFGIDSVLVRTATLLPKQKYKCN